MVKREMILTIFCVSFQNAYRSYVKRYRYVLKKRIAPENKTMADKAEKLDYGNIF
jgi:hypothetical protein